ncbi:hypothetical protein [Aquipuribacter hungaricus]|uniref:Plastocyanin n=1 Tax=Aquipuribacter hungaricus TaxID=545624 RepID=A0ABV7WHH9_9MICO
MNRHAPLSLTLVSVAAAALLVGCGSAPAGETAGTAESVETVESAGAVELPDGVSYVVEGFAFAPLTVAPGQVVDVVDGDAEPHTVTAVDGSFDTGSFDAAEPGRFTAPTTPGTYDFTCTVHPSMTGTLTVR